MIELYSLLEIDVTLTFRIWCLITEIGSNIKEEYDKYLSSSIDVGEEDIGHTPKNRSDMNYVALE